MKEVKFKEVKSTGVIERKVNFDELYELFKKRVSGFNFTPYEFLIKLSEKTLALPTLEMRFHFAEEGKEVIIASIRCVEVMEKLKDFEKKGTADGKQNNKK